MVIERAYSAGWISPDRPIAILGAGIGGIAAALAARTVSVPVAIFEKEKPAAMQSRSFRWVDPTAYDWPHVWWSRGEYPWDRNRQWPLRIEAGEGREIALGAA
jgi:glycine/D-amino acid oxidase-like deaminating enzyme